MSANNNKQPQTVDPATRYRVSRNISIFFALVMGFLGYNLHKTNTPVQESEYTLQQEFFKSAVRDQINNQTAPTLKITIDQSFEQARDGAEGAKVPFNFAGEIDVEAAKAAISEKRAEYEAQIEAQKKGRNILSAFFGFVVLFNLMNARNAQKALKRISGGFNPNPS